MDVIRQVERLLQECPVNTVLVTTSSSSTTTTMSSRIGGPKSHSKRVIGKEWNRYVTHFIHLDCCRDHSTVIATSTTKHLGVSHNNATSSSFARQQKHSHAQYLWFATITRNMDRSGSTAQPEQRQEHMVSFSISKEGIVS